MIADLLRTKQLLITAGSGGVGKTTTAAALALQAAILGRRVMVMTIDPARRLANALGLPAFTTRRHRVRPELLAATGAQVRGELHATMLDTRTTADEMVRRCAPDPEAAERILANSYYHAFSRSLAGTQEYMAVEQVRELSASGDFDLVVLDTPPAVHAIDFLDAPERLLNALDSRAVSWLYRHEEEGFGARLLGRGRQLVTRSLDRLTGGPFFDDLATFLLAFSSLFEFFKAASQAVQKLLRDPGTAFIVVAAPNPASVRDATSFMNQLARRGLPIGGIVCNRIHGALPAVPREALAGLAEHQRLPIELLERMHTGLEAHAAMAARDANAVRLLRRWRAGDEPVVTVPLFPTDVHDLKALLRIGDHLVC